MGIEIDLLQFPKIERKLGTRTEDHRAIARRFDKQFFDGSRDTGYGGYVDDGRWQAVAQRLITHYRLIANARVLDIGCAKGFLVKEFYALGIDAYGLDISGYALANCAPAARRRLFHRNANDLPRHSYALMVSINTLHNLPSDECASALATMSQRSKHQYVTLDAYRNDEERVRMEAWNLTARTILHVDEWKKMFAECGYSGDYSWFIP